jgi:hypothetical protein
MLRGEMIAMPLLMWLPLTVFDFGEIGQLFGILGVLGLLLIYFNINKIRTLKILIIDFICFLLMASPIIGRLSAVPLSLFNYNAFIFPVSIFVLSYLISLIYSYSQYLVYQREVSQ